MAGTQLKKKLVAQNLKITFHNESIDCVCVHAKSLYVQQVRILEWQPLAGFQ